VEEGNVIPSLYAEKDLYIVVRQDAKRFHDFSDCLLLFPMENDWHVIFIFTGNKS